jgi:hypothetical protein
MDCYLNTGGRNKNTLSCVHFNLNTQGEIPFISPLKKRGLLTKGGRL